MKKLILFLLIALILSPAVVRGDGWYYGAAPAGGPDYTQDANCQGAWLFATDHELEDSSGEGNTLTAGGTVTFEASYPTGFTTGNAAHFDGAGNTWLTRAFANVSANFPGKVSKTAFAVAMWIYKDINDDISVWMEIGDGEFRFGNTWITNDSDNHYFRIIDSDPTTFLSTTIYTIPVTTWVHFCYSFAGADPTGTMTYWISTTSFGNIANALTVSCTNVKNVGVGQSYYGLMIGNNGAGTLCVDGLIYQPIVFDRTLSSVEAQKIYTNGITGGN